MLRYLLKRAVDRRPALTYVLVRPEELRTEFPDSRSGSSGPMSPRSCSEGQPSCVGKCTTLGPGEVPGVRRARSEGPRQDLDRRNEHNVVHRGFNHHPAVADIDPSAPGLEIVAGAGDKHVCAWRADGSQVPGWPVFLRDPGKVAAVDPRTHKLTYRPDARPYAGSKVSVAPPWVTWTPTAISR